MQFDRSSSAKTRLIHASIAISIGVVGCVIARAPIALAPAPACPGAAEWLASLLARGFPNTALGLWIPPVNIVVAGASLALVALLTAEISGAWIPAAATALALAALPIFQPQLAPFPLATLAVSALALRQLVRDGGAARPVATCVALAAVAAIATPLALPSAALGAWIVARAPKPAGARVARTALAGAAILAGAIIMVVAAPHAPPLLETGAARSCLLQETPGIALTRAADVAAPAGILAVAFVLFAAFTRRHALRQPGPWMAAVFALTPLVSSGSGDARALGPAIAGFWMLVAIGLTEGVRACRPGMGGRLAATVLVVLLPALQIVKPRAIPWMPLVPAGHNRLALGDVRRLVAAMPLASAVIQEDAVVHVLLAASDGVWQKMGKSLSTVPRDADSTNAALRVPGLHVYALPIAQGELQHLGFRLTDAPTLPGAAEVSAGGPCQTLDPDWHVFNSLGSSTSFSMVATTPADAGPFVAYLAFDQPPVPRPIDWPAAATYGFNAATYAESAEDRARLARDAQDDGLPRGWTAEAAPFVARLDLWRAPGAPARLAIGLGQAPARAIAHLSTDTRMRLVLCPSFPYAVRAFTPAR